VGALIFKTVEPLDIPVISKFNAFSSHFGLFPLLTLEPSATSRNTRSELQRIASAIVLSSDKEIVPSFDFRPTSFI
jgi:hypothetical protein